MESIDYINIIDRLTHLQDQVFVHNDMQEGFFTQLQKVEERLDKAQQLYPPCESVEARMRQLQQSIEQQLNTSSLQYETGPFPHYTIYERKL